jgi:hypothetical protein
LQNKRCGFENGAGGLPLSIIGQNALTAEAYSDL